MIVESISSQAHSMFNLKPYCCMLACQQINQSIILHKYFKKTCLSKLLAICFIAIVVILFIFSLMGLIYLSMRQSPTRPHNVPKDKYGSNVDGFPQINMLRFQRQSCLSLEDIHVDENISSTTKNHTIKMELLHSRKSREIEILASKMQTIHRSNHIVYIPLIPKCSLKQ